MSLNEAKESVEQASQPTLCVKGCGFFSNVGSNGMCSKCYREHHAEESKTKAAEEAIAKVTASAATAGAAPEQPAVVITQLAAAQSPSPSAAAASSTPESTSKPSTRCQVCRKKVGLTGFKCKCSPDAVFCCQHRYAEAHNCCFDYKASQRAKLAAANPVVAASKVERI